MNEQNEKEFQKQMEEFLKKLKEAAESMRREMEATQVIEGQYGKYLIHLN